MSRNPNIQRLRRGTLPPGQRIHMGTLLSHPTAPSAAPQAAPVGVSPEQQAQVKKLESKVAELTEELKKARDILQQIGPPTAPPEVLLKNLKEQAGALAETQAQLLQQTSLAETLAQKVKDLEALASEAPKELDTPKPLDRVYVTTIQSRTTENGNVVVACTMHSGVESEAVSGTIVIPQSEFGKLRPPKQP